jgi:hypothetical protein
MSIYSCSSTRAGVIEESIKQPSFYRCTRLKSRTARRFPFRIRKDKLKPDQKIDAEVDVSLDHDHDTLRRGHAVAQAVNRWLPTAAARVRVRAACGVCGGESDTGAGFLPSTSVSTVNHSTNFSIIIITRGWHSRPLVAAVTSGHNSTPPPTISILTNLQSRSK